MNFKFLKFLQRGNRANGDSNIRTVDIGRGDSWTSYSPVIPQPVWEDVSTAEFIRRYLAPYAKIIDGALVVPHGTYADVAKILEVDPRYVAKVARRSGYGYVRTKGTQK